MGEGSIFNVYVFWWISPGALPQTYGKFLAFRSVSIEYSGDITVGAKRIFSANCIFSASFNMLLKHLELNVPNMRSRGQPACPRVWKKYSMKKGLNGNNYVMYIYVSVVYEM
jgi:hypothetical protein